MTGFKRSPENYAALHALCFRVPRPWRTEEFENILKSPGVQVFENPGGFLIGRITAPEAELLTLAIAPEERRQGYGRDLLQRYHNAGIASGAIESFLEVAENNAGALALYQEVGYAQVGTRPAYYRAPDGQRIDAIILSRALAQK